MWQAFMEEQMVGIIGATLTLQNIFHVQILFYFIVFPTLP